ncbi:MAG: hypothetical protein ABSB78_00280 [Bacteroidota bacterium]
MKKSLVILTVLALSLLFSQNIFAQADQTVHFEVKPVAKISVSGDVYLAVITGIAGTPGLTDSIEHSSTYSITHNAESKKITAKLNSAMPSNTTLSVELASTNGTSSNKVLLTASDNNVVTGISKCAETSMITYTFHADVSAGILTSDSRTVTFTLTD